ncbi:caspase domain-containing protein [Mycena rosella]|uniref:Caspase domain-containing protein n=1 Tax=Mycena rosella TaxID=1033263 RepID=A0AAD7GWK2_MYCRO|nr:caspase domain-containing protein [Mycena rosella]
MQNSPKSDCRVFALIIGIDQYKELHGLNGCVNDANAFKDFLTGSLHVPEAHIMFMTNDTATRANILSAFKTHLIENSRIRDHGGDTILYFYAGHGSRVVAPNNAFSVDGRVETICPHDQGATDEKGEHIHGIPDYTVHNLLQKLAASKGNNVTAIFDSCNSGGIGRGNATPRFAETSIPIPADLDNDFMYPREGRPTIPEGFRYRFMESHILLAACRDNQSAYEITAGNGVCRGRFSESLVRTLSNVSLEKTTYQNLLDLVESWGDQNPQLEGKHKARFLFNRTYPLISKKTLPVTQDISTGAYEIKMGSIEGVVPGTEFVVNDPKNNTVCFLSARKVDLYRSILGVKDSAQPVGSLPLGCQATVSNWNNNDMIMKVFITPDFDPSAESGLFPEQHLLVSQLQSLPVPRKFMRAESQADGDIELKKLAGEKFAIERLKGIIREHALLAAEFLLHPDKYNRLPIILDAVAHFNYFLRTHHGSAPIPEVSLEMHTLTGPYPNRQPSADILDSYVAEVKDDKDGRYGFTICNRSQHELFPYLFYFDPAQYTIDEWFAPPSPTMRGPLAASRDGIQATRLPIGYGIGGYAYKFNLPEGKTVDTGFLKLFVSTEYLDLGWIVQKSPFDPGFEPSSRLGAGRETIEKGQAWHALHAVITVKQ